MGRWTTWLGYTRGKSGQCHALTEISSAAWRHAVSASAADRVASGRPPFTPPGSSPSGAHSMRLFKLFGIQFTANWSWLILFALLVYVAFSTFRGLRVGFSQVELWSLAVIAAVLSVISLYGHELAHALVARAYGIPVRTISLFLLGGMAHITRESPSPRAEVLIAIAGPVTSIAVGVVAALATWSLWNVVPPVAVLGLWLAT